MGFPYLAAGVGQSAPHYPGALSVMGVPPFAGADLNALAALAADPALMPAGLAPVKTPNGLAVKFTSMVSPPPAVAQAIADAQAPQRGFAEVLDPATGMPSQVRPNGGLRTMMDSAAMPQPKHGFSGFLDRALNPTNPLGQLGRALVIAGGTPLGTAYQVMDADKARRDATEVERQRYAREQAWHDETRQDHRDDQTKPQFFTGNEDRIMLVPTTGQTKAVFDAPTDAETYARGLGIEPGSQE